MNNEVIELKKGATIKLSQEPPKDLFRIRVENPNNAISLEEVYELGEMMNNTIYDVKNPQHGNTDCVSERIADAVVDITVNAFKLAVLKTELNKSDHRKFCDSDLLKIAIENINKKLNKIADNN